MKTEFMPFKEEMIPEAGGLLFLRNDTNTTVWACPFCLYVSKNRQWQPRQ